MPETLYIGSDINTAETKVLFDERDFVDLVEERLGSDARKYLEGIIARRDEAIRWEKVAIEDANYYSGLATARGIELEHIQEKARYHR